MPPEQSLRQFAQLAAIGIVVVGCYRVLLPFIPATRASQTAFSARLAQALVAWIGFVIAGVPGAFLLGVATFFLSMVPFGPPLIWGGAALWLFSQGNMFRAESLLRTPANRRLPGGRIS